MNINKTNNHFSPQITELKKTIWLGNPGNGLRQAQQFGGIKLGNEFPTLPSR